MRDMRTIRRSSKFKKDLRKAQSQGRDLELLKDVIRTLQEGRMMAARHRDHSLSSNWEDHRECHVTPDWLLVYQVTETELRLVRLGSHSELF